MTDYKHFYWYMKLKSKIFLQIEVVHVYAEKLYITCRNIVVCPPLLTIIVEIGEPWHWELAEF